MSRPSIARAADASAPCVGARHEPPRVGAVSPSRSAGAATGSARESSRSISPASSRATSDSSPNARAIALSATPSSASPSSATAASKRSHSSLGPATRSRARAQLVGELHVPGTRMRTMREPELVRVTQRGGLLLGRVGDRPHALCEPVVGRRLDAGLERVAPALVGELDLLERHARIGVVHDRSPLAGPTVMMWSAICAGRPSARTRGRAGGRGVPGGRTRVTRRTAACDRPRSGGPATSGRPGRRRGVRS